MAEFIRAIEASRVPPDTMVTVEVGGESVLLANVDGKFYGMGAICTHEEWDLSEGPSKGQP